MQDDEAVSAERHMSHGFGFSGWNSLTCQSVTCQNVPTSSTDVPFVECEFSPKSTCRRRERRRSRACSWADSSMLLDGWTTTCKRWRPACSEWRAVVISVRSRRAPLRAHRTAGGAGGVGWCLVRRAPREASAEAFKWRQRARLGGPPLGVPPRRPGMPCRRSFTVSFSRDRTRGAGSVLTVETLEGPPQAAAARALAFI